MRHSHRNYRRLGLAAAVVAVLVAGCGSGSAPRGSRAESEPGVTATPQFAIVSSWEPTVEGTDKGSRIGYALIVANNGSAAGQASCQIWMGKKRLPGESATVEINPGEEETINGQARIKEKPTDVPLNKLSPRCQ